MKVKIFRLMIVFAATLALTLISATGGGSSAVAQAAPTHQAVQAPSAPADQMMGFVIETLPMGSSGPTKCMAEAMNPPFNWPRVDALCRAGKGQYRVKGTFLRAINGTSYTKYGPWKSVGKASTAYGCRVLRPCAQPALPGAVTKWDAAEPICRIPHPPSLRGLFYLIEYPKASDILKSAVSAVKEVYFTPSSRK